jgi:pimeloyl-ACP methyl ester carboxylesterase
VKAKIGPIVGGAVGLVAAIAATGAVHEHREVNRARAEIDPKSAALFGALPIDRESRVVTKDGVSLHVEEVGRADAGLTVVFVHGFTLNLGAFHFQRVALQERFSSDIRMVFYDQRSHGRSDKSPGVDCTIEQLGQDLGAVLDACAPNGPVVLVGHSMGGMTIMSLSDQRPEFFRRADNGAAARGRVGAVVLINTSSGELKAVTLGLPSFAARLHGPVLPVLLRRAARNVHLVEKGRALGKDLAWLITKRLSFASDVDPAVIAYCTNMISATPVDVVSDFYPALMRHDGALGLMNLVDCRVLLFGADHDALTPLAHTRTIAAALPSAELIEVVNAGHLVMLEHPDTVNGPLLELVSAQLDAVTAARSAFGIRRWARRVSRRSAG